MIKQSLILLTILFATAFNSGCKKNHTCTCRKHVGSVDEIISVTEINATKNKAKKECNLLGRDENGNKIAGCYLD